MKRHSISFILGSVITVVAIIFSAVSLVFTPYDPESMDIYNRFQGPSAEHLLGTDHFGRDILSRIMSGSLVALSSALLSVTIGALLGIVIGLVSALSPKYVSSVLQRIIDALMAFPTILIALMLVTIAGKGILPSALAVALAIVPVFSRLVYTMILETKEKLYIKAAVSYGAGRFRIAAFHLFPGSVRNTPSANGEECRGSSSGTQFQLSHISTVPVSVCSVMAATCDFHSDLLQRPPLCTSYLYSKSRPPSSPSSSAVHTPPIP